MTEEKEVIVEEVTASADSGVSDAQIFIGPKSEYYIPAFERMDVTSSVVSWNWAAFFFGPIWMFYRKMYLYGFLAYVASCVVPFSGVIIGIFGNWVYKKKTEEEIALAATYPAESRSSMLAARGGITWLPVIIIAVFTILILLMACGFGFLAALADALY